LTPNGGKVHLLQINLGKEHGEQLGRKGAKCCGLQPNCRQERTHGPERSKSAGGTSATWLTRQVEGED